MAAVQTTAEITEPLTKTSSIFALVSFTMIFIYHCIMVYRYYGKQFNASKLSLCLSSTLLIIGAFAVLFLFSLVFYETKLLCDILFIGPFSWMMFKLDLYLILVHRLYSVFKGGSELESIY